MTCSYLMADRINCRGPATATVTAILENMTVVIVFEVTAPMDLTLANALLVVSLGR